MANFRAGQIGGPAGTWAMGGFGLEGKKGIIIINIILVENSEEVRV